MDSRSGDLHRVDSKLGASLLSINYSGKEDTPRVDSRSGAGEPVGRSAASLLSPSKPLVLCRLRGSILMSCRRHTCTLYAKS